MKLQVRAAALRDLDGIYDYTLAAHGLAQAEAYVRSLWAAMKNLCAYPKSGPASDLRPGLRSLAVSRHGRSIESKAMQCSSRACCTRQRM